MPTARVRRILSNSDAQMETTFRTLWQDAAWIAEAHAWIHSQLRTHAIHLTDAIETLQTHPWGLMMRVPTDAGNLFFKAIAPTWSFEAALTQALATWQPDDVPQLIAVDTVRGWLLMRDSGARLRELIRSTRDMSAWLEILPQYARLQIALATRRAEILRFGTPDHRLETLPAQYQEMLANRELLYLDQENGLATDEYKQLQQLAPQFEAWCEELRAAPIPESLEHGDFHDANIFVEGTKYRFSDWGDACVAHPFFSMRVVLVSVENSLNLPDYSPASKPLRDAYLDAWREFGSRETLQEIFRLAFRIAQVSGALKWYRQMEVTPPDLRDEYRHGVPSLLKDFLHADLEKYPYA